MLNPTKPCFAVITILNIVSYFHELKVNGDLKSRFINAIGQNTATGRILLYESLIHHGVSNLQETGDVGALHVIHIPIFPGSVFHTIFVYTGHDFM